MLSWAKRVFVQNYGKAKKYLVGVETPYHKALNDNEHLHWGRLVSFKKDDGCPICRHVKLKETKESGGNL